MTTSTTTDCLRPTKVIGFLRPEGHPANSKIQQFTASLGGECVSPGTQADCDLAVIWGMRNKDVIAQQTARKKPYIVMERGYYGDRRDNTALMYNGLHGRGWRPLPGRVSRPRPLLRDWRNNAGDILLIGQVPGDMSLNGINIDTWYQTIITSLRKWYPQRRIVFRQHPNYPKPPPKGVDAWHYADKPLEDSLVGVGLAVMYSSTAGVELIAKGVPCQVHDRTSMVWGVAPDSNRTRWAHWLSYCQWNDRELQDGTAAKFMLGGYAQLRSALLLGCWPKNYSI